MIKTKVSIKKIKRWLPATTAALLLLLCPFNNGAYQGQHGPVSSDAAILGAGVAAAEEAASDGVTPCMLVYGYVIDPDPEGLNVRSGPGSGYAVVDRLPSPTTETYAIVTIVGSKGNWLKISQVSIFNGEEVLKKIDGWVYAPLIGTSTRDDNYNDYQNITTLREKPDHSSRTIANIPVDLTVPLLGCRGDWVKIRYNNMEGWLSPEGQCPSPVTTCP